MCQAATNSNAKKTTQNTEKNIFSVITLQTAITNGPYFA